MRIAFIGGGNMAQALIGGLIKQGVQSGRLLVVEHNPQTRDLLLNKWADIEVRAVLDEQTTHADVLLLAVKPQQLREVAQSLGPWLNGQLVLSIAAGVRTDVLSDWLGGYRRVVRAMPNTPAMIGQGVTGLYACPEVSVAQREMSRHILQAVGMGFWLDNETDLDAVTAVSGSGPAYVFYFMEAMEQAAIDLGLPAELSRQLVLQTFSGSAALAGAAGESPAVLRERVTSPGGTTESALNSMRVAGVAGAIGQALHAAALRSRELGDKLR